MGGRGSGRIPRPAKLKIVEGRAEGRDSGGRRIPLPPAFERVPPEPTDLVQRIPHAAQVWERVVADLGPLGLLKNADQDVLEAFCLLCFRWRRATVQSASEPLVLRNELSGRSYKNPIVTVVEGAEQAMHRFAQLLGVSPSTEQRLRSELLAVGAVAGERSPFDWG